jgi:hypothetical protein
MVWACELTIVNNLEYDAGSTLPQLCATLGAQKRRPSNLVCVKLIFPIWQLLASNCVPLQ